ncbi:MAG: hypothetical protein VYB73_02100, partial [Verrucomicrobiota bacterium]|nr:hypothetical protein [Verrucomicrobiota bacterium]
MKLCIPLASGLFFLISITISTSQESEKNDSLLHSWNFSKANWVKNTVFERKNKLKFEAQFSPVFTPSGHLILSGKNGLLNDSVLSSSLPKEQISAE